MVFDRGGKYLYITTSDGWVRAYNLSTGQLETGYNLGGSLNGMDIASDDSFLLVAQDVVSGSQGIFHRVDLSSGAVSNIIYNRSGLEAGAWDVAIGSNGIALATTRLPNGYSGTTPLRQIDLRSNVASIRSDTPSSGGRHEVYDTTQIYRSADRTRLYFLEAGISDGPVFTYDATTDSFGPLARAWMYFDTATAAINRNGTMLGTLVGVQYPFGSSKPKLAVDSAPGLQFLRGFSEPDSGIAFDAVADLIYAVSSSSGQIIAYDTNTFAERFRLDIGETVEKMVTQFGAGILVASQDGRYLALATNSGVRLFSVARGTPSAPAPANFIHRREIVFDHSGQNLYLTTDNGLVERYNVPRNTLDIVADLGGKLNGADIAPDDSFLIVAQDNYGVAQGMWQKVDLITGQVTRINYQRDGVEAGSWDVAIGSNGLALLTTGIPDGFSASTPLRQIDLATNTLTVRTDFHQGSFSQLNGGTHICRSADHSRMLLLEPNGSNGGLFTYSAVTNTFGPVGNTGSFLDSSSAAVNRDGSLIATRRGYPNHASVDTAPDLHFVQPLPIDGGVAFNALNDTVYGVDRARSEIIAFDAHAGTELYRFSVGEDVSPGPPVPGGPGPYTPELGYIKLVSSNDGRYLALETAQGFRLFDLLSVTPTVAPQPIFGAMRSMAFDHSGNNLYITTATGYVWPYHLATAKFGVPYYLGGSLAGIDVAPDDSFLLVAQQAMGVREGRFEKITLSDGTITRINYQPPFAAEIGWDVAVAANGLGFGTTSGPFVFQIDFTTNVATARQDFTGSYGSGLLPGLTKIRRTADAAKLAFLDDYGSVFFYTAPSNTFGPTASVNSGFNSSFALNRDASLLGVRSNATTLFSVPALNATHSFSDLSHAIIFDPNKDIVYGVNPATSEIIGYDTATFAEQLRLPIGEKVTIVQPQEFLIGAFANSGDGRYLALQCDAALRVFDLATKETVPLPLVPRVGNISTRTFVGTGDNVPIAGFVITGRDPKKIVLRAIGPSLGGAGISMPLPDPYLELHDGAGVVVASNDNWKESQEDEINRSGLAPADEREAVIIKSLSPGSYTAVMRGANSSTGIGVVEVYDLEPNAISKVANISTRGFVGTGEQLMVGGVIVRSVGDPSNPTPRQLLVRGLGPSLSQFNVPNPLQDPILEIHDSNGTTTGINDDWKIPRESDIRSTGLAPNDNREAAIFLQLVPGNFTALLRGKNNTTGAGIIEVFALP
jgi:WD40 repeat protein